MAITNSFKQKVNVGSGHIFSIAYDSATFPDFDTADLSDTITWLQANIKEANRIGYIKGGFTVAVTTEKLEDQDDLGFMKINLMTKENATATFSLFNFNAATLAEQYATAAYSEATVSDKTWGVGKVGGLANDNGISHVLIFMHHDADNGDTVVVVKGKNTNGFNMQFSADSAQPFELSFVLEAMDDAGRFMYDVNVPAGYEWTNI